MTSSSMAENVPGFDDLFPLFGQARFAIQAQVLGLAQIGVVEIHHDARFGAGSPLRPAEQALSAQTDAYDSDAERLTGLDEFN